MDDGWTASQDCCENYLCLLPLGFATLDHGPSPVGALKIGNLSSCHVFHTVLIYSCLREGGKVFCLSNHLLCMLLLLNLFSLVTLVKVCTPLSIMHWVNWMLIHTLSFQKEGAWCYADSRKTGTKCLKTFFFFQNCLKKKKDLKLTVLITGVPHANMPILCVQPESKSRLWTQYRNTAWCEKRSMWLEQTVAHTHPLRAGRRLWACVPPVVPGACRIFLASRNAGNVTFQATQRQKHDFLQC